jgi:RNA polymerase sigma factor (sigma-70 family)
MRSLPRGTTPAAGLYPAMEGEAARRPAEETELIERAKRGDVDAYAEIVRRYQDVAARTAYLVTGTAAEAEDAAQEAFVKAYYALGRFRAGAPFRPWLLRIVTNEARNRRKAAVRHPQVGLEAAELRPAEDAAGAPEQAALAAERRHTLLHALAQMREDDRLVISYRYFLDLSEAEMADALGVARGTVKSRLSRALARLRGLIDA